MIAAKLGLATKTINNHASAIFAKLGVPGRTNAKDKDSDDDGLFDGDEVNIHRTNPMDQDSDNDGESDFDEFNVLKPIPSTGPSPFGDPPAVAAVGGAALAPGAMQLSGSPAPSPEVVETVGVEGAATSIGSVGGLGSADAAAAGGAGPRIDLGFGEGEGSEIELNSVARLEHAGPLGAGDAPGSIVDPDNVAQLAKLDQGTDGSTGGDSGSDQSATTEWHGDPIVGTEPAEPASHAPDTREEADGTELPGIMAPEPSEEHGDLVY